MNKVTVQTIVNAPIATLWEYWNKPEHITGWAFASDDWEAPSAENDLRTGGTFKTRMQAKDGSSGFDFSGTYTLVENQERIEYDMDEELSLKGEKGMKRHVEMKFESTPDGVRVTATFDPENENPEEMQRSGWQAILDNFKKYVENKSK